MLMASVFHGLAANFCACVLHTLLGILRLQGYSAEIRRLHVRCKRGIVIVSAEFGAKQSHVGPWCNDTKHFGNQIMDWAFGETPLGINHNIHSSTIKPI